MSPKEVGERFSTALERLDFTSAFGMLAANGRYTVIGTTPVSRTYEGREDLFANLLPVLSTFREAPVLKCQPPIVDGDRVVIVAGGSGVGPTGPYDQPYYAFVTRVQGNEFSEIIEFMDTGMLETAVFGRKIVDA